MGAVVRAKDNVETVREYHEDQEQKRLATSEYTTKAVEVTKDGEEVKVTQDGDKVEIIQDGEEREKKEKDIATGRKARKKRSKQGDQSRSEVENDVGLRTDEMTQADEKAEREVDGL